MADATARLGLPHIIQGQAQKEVTHNEALDILEMLVQSFAISVTNDPPATPLLDAWYIVGANPTGAWIGKGKSIAGFISGAWKFVTPKNGFRVYVQADEVEYIYTNGSWVQSSGGTGDTVNFDPTGTDLTSTNVQEAIVELRNKFPSGGNQYQVLVKASSTELDHSWQTPYAERVGFEWSSAVAASNVQDAIEHLAAIKASSLRYESSLATAMDLGRYRSGSTITGTIKITIPAATFTANIRIGIKGLNRINSAMSWNADISGYYSGSTWTYADMTLSPNCPFSSVRLGTDGANPCILLGNLSTVWTQPMIWIDFATVGGSTAWEFTNSLPMSFITSETGYTINLTRNAKTLAVAGLNGCRAYRNGGGMQSIASGGIPVKVTTNDVIYDTGGYYDYTNNRIVIPSGVSYVECVASINWTEGYTTAGTRRVMGVYKNGTGGTIIGITSCACSTNGAYLNVSTGSVTVVAGDYIEFYAINDDTAAKSISAAGERVFLTMKVLG